MGSRILPKIVVLAFFVPAFAFAQTTCPSLSRGSTGASVTAVQQILYDAYQGFPSPTGYFGSVTEAAVKQWQGEHGIEQVGIVGPQTSAAMKINLCTSSNQSTSVSTSNTNNNPSAATLIQALQAKLKGLLDQIAALAATGATSTAPTTSTSTVPIGGGGGGGSGGGGSPNAISCAFNGLTIASGSNVTAYLNASVAAGSQCVSETRSCSNGTLSGSYTYSSCTVGQALGRQYWFSANSQPPPGSPDYTSSSPYNTFWDLFQPNVSWPTVLGKINALVLLEDPNNYYYPDDAKFKSMLAFAKQNGLKIVIAADPLDANTNGTRCQNEGIIDNPVYFMNMFIDRIEKDGGSVDGFAFDEPWYHATYVCTGSGWTNAEIAQQMDAFIKAMRARPELSNLQFWDGEPMFDSQFKSNLPALEKWLADFKTTNNYPMPGFQVEFVNDSGQIADMKSLETYVKQQGTPFGVLYNGGIDTTNSAWAQDAGQKISTYELRDGGNPDLVVFASWNNHPDHPVPETTFGTMTNLPYRYFTDKNNIANVPNPPGQDGKADILWQNTSTGLVSVTFMNGTSPIGSTNSNISANPGASWKVVAVADFNGDGLPDLLLQNSDGTPGVWLINALTLAGNGALPNPGTSWTPVATGDFNGDGKADILWQNSDGTPGVWLMNGTSVLSEGGGLGSVTGWKFAAVADFNGDGKADILWQNTSTAQAAIWFMNGTSLASSSNVIGPPMSGWNIVGAGDFDGDDHQDILWQNSDGTPAIWFLNNSTVTSTATLTNPGAGWHVLKVADFNGDGKADILWQKSDGTLGVWLMNGSTVVSSGPLTNPGAGWQVVGTGDFGNGN